MYHRNNNMIENNISFEKNEVATVRQEALCADRHFSKASNGSFDAIISYFTIFSQYQFMKKAFLNFRI